jgi:hypothetical protein
MTYRQLIKTRVGRLAYGLLLWLGLLSSLLISALFDNGKGEALRWIVLGGVFTVFVVLWLLFLKKLESCLACPNCHGDLTKLAGYASSPLFVLPTKIRFCPFCGLAFDAEIR